LIDLETYRIVPCVPSDLRITRETQFSFDCVVCWSTVDAPLDWIGRTDPPSEPFDRDKLRALGQKYGGEFQTTPCKSCQAEYILRVRISETSWDAWRAFVQDVWLVPDATDQGDSVHRAIPLTSEAA
jgi:hypothetical protein